MSGYSVTFVRSARKELEALEANDVKRIMERIEALAGEPRPRGCHKLKGEKHLWRIRIGNYRAIYSVSDETRSIEITGVRHRSEAYR